MRMLRVRLTIPARKGLSCTGADSRITAQMSEAPLLVGADEMWRRVQRRRNRSPARSAPMAMPGRLSTSSVAFLFGVLRCPSGDCYTTARERQCEWALCFRCTWNYAAISSSSSFASFRSSVSKPSVNQP